MGFSRREDRVREGVVVEIEDGDVGQVVVRKAAGERQAEPNVHNVAEMSIGMNPKDRLTRMTPADGGAPGSAHIGTGTNITLQPLALSGTVSYHHGVCNPGAETEMRRMPKLTKVLTQADLAAARARPVMDLAPYLHVVEEIVQQGGVGGEITLGPNESQRTEKRRLSLAAKSQGYQLTWRKSPAGQLKFVIYRPGEAAPGGRKRKEK